MTSTTASPSYSAFRKPPAPASPDRYIETVRALVDTIFGPASERDYAIRLWDGRIDAQREAPRFTLIIRRPGALRRMMLPPSELALGEAYLRDDIDVEGDLGQASSIGDILAGRMKSPARLLKVVRLLRRLPTDDLPQDVLDAEPERPRRWYTRRKHTTDRDRATVRYHYDVGNEFYQLWLDPRMQYSCAYFAAGSEDLATAQEAKLEHICRKLRLRPGMRLLDIGCGWGGLMAYAAEKYDVTAVGITLSQSQASLARERLVAAGLASRCDVRVMDYRELRADAEFDRAVSVGMREHVGSANLPAYFGTVVRALRPGGLFLDHGITRSPWAERARRGLKNWVVRRLWRRDAFIMKYVFPDGELDTIGTLLRIGEDEGLEARDVESLREHYVQTLSHWVRNLEAHEDEARSIVGERTMRIWKLYMAATALGFGNGRLSLCQTLYAKPLPDGTVELPPSRSDLYR